MSTQIFNKFRVQYKCPECETKNILNIPYVNEILKLMPVTVAIWCKRCQARHRLDSMVKVNKKGQPKLKVIEFKSEDINYNKKFKILT